MRSFHCRDVVIWPVCVCVCAGFKVAVISRDSSRLDRLRSLMSATTKDNLTTIVGNVGKSGSSLMIFEATEYSGSERLYYLILTMWETVSGMAKLFSLVINLLIISQLIDKLMSHLYNGKTL